MKDQQPLNDDDHTREMYALYGLAMYFAQIMEAGVRFALATAKLSNSPTANQDDFDDLLSNSSKSVLGRLIRAFKPFLTNDATLESDLEIALQARNRLAHHFFWDHAIDAMSTEGRNLMMAESVSARDLFDSVTVRLDNMTRQYLVARGLSIVQIEELLQNELHALRLQDKDRHWNSLEPEIKS